MKYHLLERLRAFARKASARRPCNESYCRGLTNSMGTEEFRLYRLGEHQIGPIIAAAGRISWLNFYLFERAGQEEFTMLDQDFSGQNEAQRHGILLSLAPEFLPENMRHYIRSLQQRSGSRPISTSVNTEQHIELHNIMNKIEELLVCDYIFRREYVQELAMQLVHFLLKRNNFLQHQVHFNIHLN